MGEVLEQGRHLLNETDINATDINVSPIVDRLRAAGCVFADDEARLLLEASDSTSDLEVRLRRREAGEPLEVILGWAEFCGLRVAVDPGVFVPRRRSALLVDLAVEELSTTRRPLVVDLCCGTGALGLAVAARATVDLVAAELDPVAVACARRNLDGVAEVFAGDLFAALPAELRSRVDVILANAPYVPTADIALMPPEARLHEPRAALDGGDDGLRIHRRIACEAADWLAPGGRLLIEVAERQAEAALDLLRSAGLVAEVRRDADREAVAALGRHDPGWPAG